jgi:hypothetical protein
MEGLAPNWRKSSYSGNGGECVEVSDGMGLVLVQDTNSRAGGTLEFSVGAWRSFTSALKKA